MAPSTVRCQKVKGTCEVSKVFDQQNFMIAAVTVMRTAFCASAFAEKILHCRQQGTGMHKNRQTNLMQAQGPGTRHVYPAMLDIINKTETGCGMLTSCSAETPPSDLRSKISVLVANRIFLCNACPSSGNCSVIFLPKHIVAVVQMPQI